MFDVDGSTHGVKGPADSEVVERLFADALQGKGINVTAAKFTGGSDYEPFMNFPHKPIDSLHTGTGVNEDPCYHRPCDVVDGINPQTLTINAKVCFCLLTQRTRLAADYPGGNRSGAFDISN